MYKCSYCNTDIEQDEIYYVFNNLNVCEKCLPDHLIKHAETADYGDQLCKFCKGKGFIMIHGREDTPEDCPECKGLGLARY